MSGEPGTAQEVAEGLIGGLEHGGALVVRGEFKLDYAKARSKLAAYQLGTPDRYVLLLVEAAHLLRGCTRLGFVIERRSTRVVFAGVELGAEELRGWIDVLFVNDDGLDEQGARHLRGRQRLALALNAALPSAGEGIELRVRGPAGELQLAVDEREVGELEHRAGQTSEQPWLSVELVHGGGLSSAWTAIERTRTQRELLARGARYATVEVIVNGERVSGGLDAAALIDPVEVIDDGVCVGQAGWSNDGSSTGLVELLANGAVVETVAPPTKQRNLRAVIDASDLPRSLSLDRFRRGPALTKRLEAVARARTALVGPTPRTLGTNFVGLRYNDYKRKLWGASAAAAVASVGAVGAEFFFALAVSAVMFVVVSVLMVRNRKPMLTQRDGIRRLARVVTRNETFRWVNKRRISKLQLSVEGPDGQTYAASTESCEDGKATPKPGDRVFVRVDPNAPERVVLDAASER